MHAVCGFAQLSVEVHAHGICALVWGCNVHACFEDVYVALGQVVACCAVYEYWVEWLCLADKFEDFVQVCLCSVVLDLLAPVVL